MNNIEWVIWGKYGHAPKEEIDSFDDLIEAGRMLSEYRIAYGAGWRLWIAKRKVKIEGENNV